ncbi:hypothetical protein ACFL59_13725 [Planctomycetota bacterium]
MGEREKVRQPDSGLGGCSAATRGVSCGSPGADLERHARGGNEPAQPLDPNVFSVLWHRAGNTATGVAEVLAAAKAGPRSLSGRPVQHGVELDLKWARASEGLLLYAWHGPTGLERLTACEVLRRASRGEVLLLERLFSEPRAEELIYMIEIKTGYGPRTEAVGQLSALLDRYRLGHRVLLATGSVAALDDAARAAPALPRLLFTSHVTRGGRAFQIPLLGFPRDLRHGVLVSGDRAGVHCLCKVGVLPRAAKHHLSLARRAARRGTAYLPGRVTSLAALEEMAAEGLLGAFAYLRPRAWGERSGSSGLLVHR